MKAGGRGERGGGGGDVSERAERERDNSGMFACFVSGDFETSVECTFEVMVKRRMWV